MTGLYVENNYYFAVVATDAGGNRSPILPTLRRDCTCDRLLRGAPERDDAFGCRWRHRAVRLPVRLGRCEQVCRLGGSVVFGPGRRIRSPGTRLPVPGAAGTVPTAPSVTFTGDATTTASFGRGVAIIGDIDADGFTDVAVSDRGTPAHIYIYKGRTTWPVAMTNLDANYVISVDATYSGSIFGAAMARLGDFNGDGIDDFALGANLFGGATQVGRIVVILGSATFASFALPNATNSIVIDGDPAVTTSQFGYRVLGLGHFYSVTRGRRWSCRLPATSRPRADLKGGSTPFTDRTVPPGHPDCVGRSRGRRSQRQQPDRHRAQQPRPILGGLALSRQRQPGRTRDHAQRQRLRVQWHVGDGSVRFQAASYQASAGLSGIAVFGGGISGSISLSRCIGMPTPRPGGHLARRAELRDRRRTDAQRAPRPRSR